ncbi:MAG TPA: penicillin-binding protein 2 [Caulobacteraceae bacterium]
MTALSGPFPGGQAPSPWRWLSTRLWWMEHAFERARASGKAEDDTRLRIFFVLALFSFAFLTLGLAATKAALFSGLGHESDEAPPMAGARADLVDRNGQILAVDLVHYGLYVDPRDVSDGRATQTALLAALPQIAPARLEKILAGGRREYLIGDLTPEVKARVHDLALPGVGFEEETGRAYPLGETAAHLIGFASSDGAGLAGAERAFDGQIRSQAGKAPVALSIDLRVQGALQDELEKAAEHFQVLDGAAMVVNVRTGEILAMASYPAFDPNAPGKAEPSAMVNHAAATVYEPGSVFKVFTLAMGLDSGVTDVYRKFDVHTPLVLPGQTIHDYDKGDETLPLWEVFTHSSNIGAARMALLAGADRMERYWRAFGLYRAAPSELIESARPLVPRRMTDNAVASMAFGHSISVSPLTIATGMSAILNGGLYRPLTLRKLEPGQAPAPGRRVIQASTSRTMLNLMRLNATNGTGRSANIAGYRVGGKTGTATKLVNGRYNGAKKNLASFAAIFPTDGPLDEDRYYVLIMMDEPQNLPETGGFLTGGVISAPIAGKVIERIAPLLGVPRAAAVGDVPDPRKGKDDIDFSILTAGQR